MAHRAVRKFAASLGGVTSGAPVGAVVLLVAGAARLRGLMGRVSTLREPAVCIRDSQYCEFHPILLCFARNLVLSCLFVVLPSPKVRSNKYLPFRGSKSPHGSTHLVRLA